MSEEEYQRVLNKLLASSQGRTAAAKLASFNRQIRGWIATETGRGVRMKEDDVGWQWIRYSPEGVYFEFMNMGERSLLPIEMSDAFRCYIEWYKNKTFTSRAVIDSGKQAYEKTWTNPVALQLSNEQEVTKAIISDGKMTAKKYREVARSTPFKDPIERGATIHDLHSFVRDEVPVKKVWRENMFVLPRERLQELRTQLPSRFAKQGYRATDNTTL